MLLCPTPRELEAVNQKLQDLYGDHLCINKPQFRVTWANTEKERRKVIVSPTLTETRTVLKYPWLRDQFIVEQLVSCPYEDIHEGEYSYECMFAFPEGLPLSQQAAVLVIDTILERVTKAERDKAPKTQKECDYREAEKLEKAKTEIRDMIDTTSLETSLHDGSAQFLDGSINYKPSEQVN